MARCGITLVANAGVLVRLGPATVLVDGLHDEKTADFSTVTAARWAALREHLGPAGPSLILFTHCHPDHFSEAMAGQAHALWPQAPILLPGDMEGGYRLAGAGGTLTLPGLTVRFARLPHDGAQFADVVQYGYLLEREGFRLLLSGDCALCAPALGAFAGRYGPVDAAVMAFPWLTLGRCRRYLTERIGPRYLLACHLPFSEDDRSGYRAAAEKSAPLLAGTDVRLLERPFQTEYLD